MERDQLNEYDRALYDAFMSLAVRKSIRVIMGEIETSAIDQSCPLLRERRKSGHPSGMACSEAGAINRLSTIAQASWRTVSDRPQSCRMRSRLRRCQN